MKYKTKQIGRAMMRFFCTKKSWRLGFLFRTDGLRLSLLWIHFSLMIMPKGFNF
jgi:hypothetical protein